MLPQYKSQYICVLGMQITQSAQSVQITEYTCRQPHVGVFVQLLPRPACFGDYSYKYHLTTNTVGTTAGTTGTCGDGDVERWRALAGRNWAAQPGTSGARGQRTSFHQHSPAPAPSSGAWRLQLPECFLHFSCLCFPWPLALRNERSFMYTCIHTHTFFWRIPQIFMNIVSCGLSAAGGVIFPYFPHLWIFLSERAAGSSLASPTSNVNILCM